MRRFHDAHAERSGNVLPQGGFRGFHIETHLAAQETVGAQPSEHQVGVGDRRPLAAHAVAGRPRRGARAFRSDMQRAAFGHARDRSAAGPDLENVDHRNLDRERLLVAADQRASSGHYVSAMDHAGFRRGAAHVERDRVVDCDLVADRLRCDHARCRPRFQHAHAFLPRMFDFEEAAGRLHDEESAGKARSARVSVDLGEIASDLGADIGVGRDRR